MPDFPSKNCQVSDEKKCLLKALIFVFKIVLCNNNILCGMYNKDNCCELKKKDVSLQCENFVTSNEAKDNIPYSYKFTSI